MNFNLLAWVSLAIIVCNLYLLSAGRLTGMIRGVAVQGFLLSLLPLLLPSPVEPFHLILLVALGILIKAIIIPRYLYRAIRGVRLEIRPTVDYSLSVIYGILTSVFSFYVIKRVPLASAAVSPFHTSIAIATAFIGIFLIVTRRNVVSQIIGYLVFENAGFILGISVAAFQPFFVELGILLDMLAGVFIMVMAVHHIHTRHETLNIESLEKLTR